jgi:hypothetical protein
MILVALLAGCTAAGGPAIAPASVGPTLTLSPTVLPSVTALATEDAATSDPATPEPTPDGPTTLAIEVHCPAADAAHAAALPAASSKRGWRKVAILASGVVLEEDGIPEVRGN